MRTELIGQVEAHCHTKSLESHSFLLSHNPTVQAFLTYLVQLSRAPSAFMSSRNAMYESSILCGFDADDEPEDCCFATAGATTGRLEVVGVVVFGFALGSADSLLTRTDAGTCKITILRSISWDYR